MSDQDPFLRAIREAPEDPAPALIYADWLEEHGRADRAQFIRLSVDLAGRDPSDPDRAGLRLWVADISARMFPEWCKELPKVRGMTWDPPKAGFFRSITLHHLGSFLANAPAILDAAPVTTIRLDLQPGQLLTEDWGRFSALPDLRPIRELVARQQGLNVGLSRPLLENPALENLRKLDLWENTIGAGGAKAIAKAPHMANLESLDLQANAIKPSGAKALAGSTTLERLEELNLRYSQMNREGLEALATTQLPRLSRLNIGANNLIDDDLRLLAESPLFPRLRSLNLASNQGITGRGLRSLLEAGRSFPLEEWNLSGADLTPEVLIMLAKSDRLSGLRRLNLAGADWTPAAAEAFAKSAALRNLEILWVDSPIDPPAQSSRPLRTLVDAFGTRLAHTNLYSEYPGRDETDRDDHDLPSI
jgi:uncharacterized protein (TIGR02996 family)